MVKHVLGIFVVSATAFMSCTSVSFSAGLGEMCGGIAGIQCDKGLWCDPEPGKCGGADIAGKCVTVPTACTREFKPVCGCDNKTYGNNCERLAAKVAMKSEGECPKEYK